MKKSLRGFRILAAVILVFSLVLECGVSHINYVSVMAKETIKTGICGDNADWYFNMETGVLTVTGSGEMYDNPGFHQLNIKKVVIEEGITSIGMDAFIYMSSITELVLPQTLEKIGSWAFWGCEGIHEISLPSSLKSIGEVAFEKCTSLKRVSVNSQNKMFTSVDGVLYSKDMREILLYPAAKDGDSFEIPGSVKSVGLYAFDYNQNLKMLTIPASVETLGGTKPFTGAISLTEICVDKENRKYSSIDGNIYSKDGTKLIKYAMGKADGEFTIPNHVTSIESRAFQNCNNLKKITVLDSVISIGADAFDTSIGICAYQGSAAYEYAIGNGLAADVLEAKEIKSIEIQQLPKKIKFAVGDTFNSVGLIIKVDYTDGTFGLRNKDLELEGFNSEKTGECIITVRFGEFWTTYKVEIVDSIEKEQIVPGQKINVDIIEKGQIYYMNFTPEKTGEYNIVANSGSDTYGIVYDEAGNVVASNDDTATGSDFSITHTFEGGVTYIVAVAFSDEEELGSFQVEVKAKEKEESTTVKSGDETTTHEDVKPTTPPTWNYEERTTYSKIKVPRAKVKSALKKKGSKTIKISLKKIKGVKKYKIQVSTSKKFKKILVRKTVKKVSFKIKSKKLKNRKKLYVRAKAIKVVNKKSCLGKWSKAKKIKVKK